MLLLLFVVLFVVSFAALIVVVKGNERLKAQHRAYVSSVNSVYDNHSNIIIGLQGQVEDLLAQRADDQEVISSKDHHIAGLVGEIKKAAETAAELEAATASEFALKAKLDNTVTNYKKLEAYSVSGAKKSNNKKFDDCLFEDDYIMEIEKELGIHWFK